MEKTIPSLRDTFFLMLCQQTKEIMLSNLFSREEKDDASFSAEITNEIKDRLSILIRSNSFSFSFKGSQLSVERQSHSRLTIVTVVTCALVLFTMAAFALLYYIKRNDRIRNKLAEITHIKGLSTNYYQVKFISTKERKCESFHLRRICAGSECKCNQRVANHRKFINHRHHLPVQRQHQLVVM